MNAIRSISSFFDRPFGQSVVGRIASCASFEFVGSQIGSMLGGPILGSAMRGVGRVFVPIAVASGAIYALRKKTTRAAAAVLGISIAASLIPRSLVALYGWGPTIGLLCGSWLGENLGAILGGYAGLKLARSSVPFWDHTVECDSYLIGMAKFILAGKAFEEVIVRSTLPLISVPINLARATAKIAFQTMAYYSNSVISFLRERKFSRDAILPVAVKVICARYCEENAHPITISLTRVASSIFGMVPEAERQFQRLLNILLSDQVNGTIRQLGQRSDRYAVVLMRAFPKYVELVEECDKSRPLKEALKEKMEGSRNLSRIISPLLREKFSELSKTFVRELELREYRLTGHVLTEIDQKKLSFHIKYFLIYVLLNYDLSPLSLDEEKAFFLELMKIYFSFHSHYLALWTEKIMCIAIRSFFGFKKWGYYLVIEQPEQRSLASARPVAIQEGYPPKVESPRAEFRPNPVGKHFHVGDDYFK